MTSAALIIRPRGAGPVQMQALAATFVAIFQENLYVVPLTMLSVRVCDEHQTMCLFVPLKLGSLGSYVGSLRTHADPTLLAADNISTEPSL